MNINAVVVDSTPESKLEPMVFRQEEVLVSMDSEANALSLLFHGRWAACAALIPPA